jgi:hypothetical protein
MRPANRLLVASVFLTLGPSGAALAGMPSLRLNDVARMRFETISFFLVGLLLSALVIKLLWNRLAHDFTLLPRLSYLSALAVVVLWGLLFTLVLTMISGARELMTPGAWEKQGFTYRLAEPPKAEPETNLDRVRQEKLAALRSALWLYADAHGGRFPSDIESSGLPKQVWETPDASGMQYVYVGGQVAGRGAKPLAYEPELYGPRRLALLTSGDVRFMDSDEILRSRPGGTSR